MYPGVVRTQPWLSLAPGVVGTFDTPVLPPLTRATMLASSQAFPGSVVGKGGQLGC